MKSWEVTSNVVRSIAFILLMTTLCLAQLNTNKQGFVNTKGRKILPSNSTLKIETATSSIACSTLCCMLGSCCYASYDKKTRQCILEESCCPQSELSGEALMMMKNTGSSQCLNGWFQNGNKCYFFSDEIRNWTDAKVCTPALVKQ
ncbi:Hypothetical predicted protein [Mytilus galloprovincialis]|uniref:Uncharacterized protein n=1 Tax=Mytilus galloprovincialis TaxID=29158 RepID=A0A8B6BZC1_MYTGA|nr:Hypothetical predicted protein [Mytilus galloprovincialis]